MKLRKLFAQCRLLLKKKCHGHVFTSFYIGLHKWYTALPPNSVATDNRSLSHVAPLTSALDELGYKIRRSRLSVEYYLVVESRDQDDSPVESPVDQTGDADDMISDNLGA